MTTVKDLIERLSKFPPDASVVHYYHSEVVDLNLEDVEFVLGSKSRLIRWAGEVKGRASVSARGDYITFHPGYMPEGFVPEFIDAVHLPG